MTTSLWQLLWYATHWVCHVCKHWHSSICSRLSPFEEKGLYDLRGLHQLYFQHRLMGNVPHNPEKLPGLSLHLPGYHFCTSQPFLFCSAHFTCSKLSSAPEKCFFSRYIQTDNSQNTSKPQWFNRGTFQSLFFLGKQGFQALNDWHWSDS